MNRDLKTTEITVLLCLLLFYGGCQKSGENPFLLFEKKEYKAAFERADELAGNNDASAQYLLGRMFAEGKGTLQDFTEAAVEYRSAAEQGHCEAMFALGELYYLGKGVSQDDEKAAFWFRRAAEAGSLEAEQALARMYSENRGGVPLQDISSDEVP
ncbi:tetratricopeptide repeat protein [Chlorobium limicola]